MRPAANRLFAAATFLLLLGLSACSDSPTAPRNLTFDEAIAELNSGLSAASRGIAMAGGYTEPSPNTASLCAHDDEGDFECNDTPIAGFDVSKQVLLYDLAGNVLPIWSSEVFAVRQIIELSGSRVVMIGESAVTFELDAKDDHVLRGIGTPTLHLSGEALATLKRTSGPAVHTVRTLRETDLELGGPGVPPTGTVVVTVTHVESELNAKVTITFDGTDIVNVEIIHPWGPIVHCTFSLASPGTPAACS
jgi:hypothetical protein